MVPVWDNFLGFPLGSLVSSCITQIHAGRWISYINLPLGVNVCMHGNPPPWGLVFPPCAQCFQEILRTHWIPNQDKALTKDVYINKRILWLLQYIVISEFCLFSLEPLGGVRNLQVIDPTASTLNVRWDHADGNPRHYKVFYVSQPGTEEKKVKIRCLSCWNISVTSFN